VPETSIRFGLKNNLNKRSSIWKCWTNVGTGESSVYITNRAIGKALKASLHQTGLWHIAFDSHFLKKEVIEESRLASDRFVDKWLKPPEIGAGCTLALRIIIPDDAVTIPISDKDPQSTVWITAPPTGKAIEIVLLFTAPRSNVSGWPGHNSMGTQLLGSFQIENGYRLWIVHYVIDKPAMDPKRGTLTHFKSGKGVAQQNRKYRAIIFSQANDGSRILFESNVEIHQKGN
jgi:hypothetical protein